MGETNTTPEEVKCGKARRTTSQRGVGRFPKLACVFGGGIEMTKAQDFRMSNETKD